MLALPLPELPAPVAPTALFAATTLHALAREEAAGRRPKRLLEEKRAAWERFRGRLGPAALVELLLEDAAVTQPAAFDASAILGPAARLAELPEPLVTGAQIGIAEHLYPVGRCGSWEQVPPTPLLLANDH